MLLYRHLRVLVNRNSIFFRVAPGMGLKLFPINDVAAKSCHLLTLALMIRVVA